jgi:hypothetical protein
MKNIKYFIIKTDNGFFSVKLDYFKNRLSRQTQLNLLATKSKLYKSCELVNSLNNYVKGAVSTTINLEECEMAILQSVTDNKGIYIKNVFEEKRQIFLSTFYNKTKELTTIKN